MQTYRHVALGFALVVEEVAGPVTDAEHAEHLRVLRERMRRDRVNRTRVVTVVDLTHAAPLSAKQRGAQAQWMKENEELIRAVSLGAAYVVPSPLIRGVLTAVFWVRPPLEPYGLFATRDEAFEWARERLREAGAEPPEEAPPPSIKR